MYHQNQKFNFGFFFPQMTLYDVPKMSIIGDQINQKLTFDFTLMNSKVPISVTQVLLDFHANQETFQIVIWMNHVTRVIVGFLIKVTPLCQSN